MDELTQVSVPEGWIDLGIGQPHRDILPLDLVAKAAGHRFNLGDPDILQYGMQQGDSGFRDHLAHFLAGQYGAQVDPDQLFITGGISQALDQICTLMTKPGDVIIVEEPSYFLALRIFKDFGLQIVSTPIDADGLIIEALEENLARHQPVLLYTIPTFHNPAGATLSEQRRKELVALSERHDFHIIADEVYQLLSYTARPPLPLAYFDTSRRVFSLGSFSKILAPGLRLGWMQAKPDMLEPFAVCGFMDSGGGLNPFVSAIVKSMLELGLQDDYLNSLKSTYRRRMLALSSALKQYIPKLSFNEPGGGYFIWSHLDEDVNAEDLLGGAQKCQTGFQPGIKFSSDQGLNNYLRFCFAFYGVSDLEEGVRRLAKVIK